MSINNHLLKSIASGLAGTLLGLVGPFKVVGDYLKGLAENREVGNQLPSVLQSLDLFETSAKASREIGEELYTTFDRLPLSMSVQEAVSPVPWDILQDIAPQILKKEMLAGFTTTPRRNRLELSSSNKQ